MLIFYKFSSQREVAKVKKVFWQIWYGLPVSYSIWKDVVMTGTTTFLQHQYKIFRQSINQI
jgi:hypothetical protein